MFKMKGCIKRVVLLKYLAYGDKLPENKYWVLRGVSGLPTIIFVNNVIFFLYMCGFMNEPNFINCKLPLICRRK